MEEIPFFHHHHRRKRMPLTFDYSLEKLQTYTGINPRPADFDAYWNKALAEMHALDPQIELVSATRSTVLITPYSGW